MPDNDSESLKASIDNTAQSIRKLLKGSKLQKVIIIELLVLLIINPLSLKWVQDFFEINIPLPKYFYLYFGLIATLLFFYAVWIRFKEISIYSATNSEFTNSSAIKGPLSFQPSDASIFKNLERQNEIQQYSNSILQPFFRIGILTAPSGCGKSSLLNAGILPALNSKGENCLVINFTNQSPIDSIIFSIREQLNIDLSKSKNVAELLDNLIQSTSKQKYILVLDQFEQFFTQFKSPDERKGFINDMKEIYTNRPSIKLLISIRSDFLNYLHEIQEQLHYTLDTSRNYFTLKKFSVQQAVAIFMFIAKTENIESTEISFIEKICKDELASDDDGLISPVDIQIISLVIKNNKDINTAFTAKSFYILGGIEGLLKKYIEDQVNAPNLFSKELTISILISLIDSNKIVRAGQLTEEQISEKLNLDKSKKIDQILIWLESVRLIHKIGTAPAKYELAHELLINPLFSFINETNHKFHKANNLLETRSIEWIRSNKNNRYLFNFSELLLIRRNRKLLNWTNNEIIKKDLIQNSFKKFKVIVSIVIGISLLFIGALLILKTEWYIFNYQIKNKLANHVSSALVSNDDKEAILDTLLLYDEDFALRLINDLQNKFVNTRIISNSTEFLASKKPIVALGLLDKITYEFDKSSTYKIIIDKIADSLPERAIALLPHITDSATKCRAYVKIITTSQLNKNNYIKNEALELANRIKITNSDALDYLADSTFIKDPKFSMDVVKLFDEPDDKLDHYLEFLRFSEEYDSLTEAICKKALTLISEEIEPEDKSISYLDFLLEVSEIKHSKINIDSIIRLVENHMHRITDLDDKSELSENLGYYYAFSDPQKSISFMERIDEKKEKKYDFLIEILADSLPLNALEYVRLIPDSAIRLSTYETLLPIIASEYPEKAISLARIISSQKSHDPDILGSVYLEIIKDTNHSNHDYAIKIVDSIRYPAYKVKALSIIIDNVEDESQVFALSKKAFDVYKEPLYDPEFLQKIIKRLIKENFFSAWNMISTYSLNDSKPSLLISTAEIIIKDHEEYAYQLIRNIQKPEKVLFSLSQIITQLRDPKKVDSLFETLLPLALKNNSSRPEILEDLLLFSSYRFPYKVLPFVDSINSYRVHPRYSPERFIDSLVLRISNNYFIKNSSEITLVSKSLNFSKSNSENTIIFKSVLYQKLGKFKKAYKLLSNLNSDKIIMLELNIYRNWKNKSTFM